MNTPGVNAATALYKDVSVADAEDGFVVRLAGKTAKTPAGKVLSAPTRPLAEAIAAEWRALKDAANPELMPRHHLAVAVIDFGAARREEWAAEIVQFAQTDLVCYRAETPAALGEAQSAAWDPVLSWADKTLGVRMRCTSGVSAVAQSPDAMQALQKAIEKLDVWRLGGLLSATKILGSAMLALALERHAFPTDRLFRASLVDEDFQRSRWGVDAEAAAREQRLETAFNAVADWFSKLDSQS